MTLHAVRNSPLITNFDFINNPVLFTANNTGTVNIVANSYGAALNPTGKRLWNQAALPLNSTNNLLSGQSVAIPFIATNLPAEYFDAIIILTVDGITKLPYAFTNSPDNTEPTSLVADKILYWTDLWTFGLNNTFGNNNTANNYTFGGISAQAEASLNYKLNFSQPLIAPLTYTWQINYVSYTLGLNSYTFTGNTTAPIGATSSTYFIGNLVIPFFNNSGRVVYQTPGYYLVSFTITDTNYRSLLKKYHWGIA